MNKRHLFCNLYCRFLQSVMLLTLLAASMLMLNSCSDDELVSTTDSKPMPYTAYSTTVTPGEDYYEYCLGPWLETGEYDTGTLYQAVDLNTERVNKTVGNSSYTQYIKSLRKNMITEEGRVASIGLLSQWLERTKNTTTKTEAIAFLYDLTNRTMQAPPLLVYPTIDYNGIIRPCVEAMYTTDDMDEWFYSEEGQQALQIVQSIRDGKKIILSKGTRLTVMKERLASLSSIVRQGKTKVRKMSAKLDSNNLPKPKLLAQPTTRATDNDNSLLGLMVKGHQYTTAYSSYEEYQARMQAITDLNNYLSNLSADSLVALGLSYVAKDVFMATSQVLTGDMYALYKYMCNCAMQQCDMMSIGDYYAQYTSDETRRNITDMAERLRKTYRNRIANSSWLSSTAKAYARQKLDSMAFHILSAGNLPPLCKDDPCTDKNLLAHVYDRMGQMAEYTTDHLYGKRLRDVMVEFYALYEPTSMTACNAYYLPEANAMTILPAFGLSPLYDASQTDAMLYAFTGMVVGHEMTHGFDSNGAKFSLTGGAADWWTMEDKLKYSSMQQKLIDCYNNIYIGYGRYQDGEKTLDENIADCGGLNIAFDAYTDLLNEQGYSGETLKEQQRKMLRCYAQMWAMKYSEPFLLEKLNTDVHSNYRARVNGPVMNFDAFYNLYDVKSGDKMYLAPDSRSKIW